VLDPDEQSELNVESDEEAMYDEEIAGPARDAEVEFRIQSRLTAVRMQ
jgi:hypothetical protein